MFLSGNGSSMWTLVIIYVAIFAAMWFFFIRPQKKEQKKMQEIRQQLGNNFCRRCNYCAPCTVGINIPQVFLLQGYLDRYGLGDWARDRYSALPVKASACVECGACEPRCPYQLPIRSMLKDAAQKFDC